MKKLNNTPGDWTYNGQTNAVYGGTKTEGRPHGIYRICNINKGGLGPCGGDVHHNVRLITAAPNMYEALMLIEKHFPKDTLIDQMGEDYDKLSDVFEKLSY